jgi:hypothetical protein
MVRRREPYLTNLGKRLVKSPKVYVRDSGMLHALLGGFHGGGGRMNLEANVRCDCCHDEPKNCGSFRRFLHIKANTPPTLLRRRASRSSRLLCSIACSDRLLTPPIRILTST